MSSKAQKLNQQEGTNDTESNQPLDRIRPQSKYWIQKIMINVVMLSFMMGYTVVYFNAIKFQDLMVILDINFEKALAQGFFTSCIPASACVGALLSRTFLKFFSRKQCFYMVNAMSIFGILLIQTKYLPLIIIGRLLQGALVGVGTAVVPLYIKQFVPQMNGKYGLYNQLLYTFGIVCGFLFNLILHSILEDPSIYWRWLFAFPLAICLVQAYVVTFHYNYQTPRYLISIKKYQEAKQLLKKIYKEQYVEDQFKILYEAVHSTTYTKNTEDFGQSISEKSIEKQNKHSSHYQIQDEKLTESTVSHEQKQLLNVSNKPTNNSLAVFCALHLAFQQQIIGIGVVIVYSGDIIKEIVPSLFYYYASIVHVIGLFCVLLGIYLIRRFGRVILLQVGAVIISVCLLILGINFLLGENRVSWMIVMSVIVLRATFSCTLGPIPWLYMAEIVKPNIIPYGTLINWSIATLVMFLFPILSQKLGGPGWIFLMNAFLCILTMIINAFTLVETKNKNELTIRQNFDEQLEEFKKGKIVRKCFS